MNLTSFMTKILTKKSRGYKVREQVEEYVMQDGQLMLTKRKISTKHVPPDINALKALVQLSQLGEVDVASMSDEQLEIEKLRLIKMLSICDNAIATDNKEEQC